MQNKNISYPLDLYNENLKIINGVSFTPREIDIIACLLNRRAASISSFLSISARSVETHTRHIRQKAGELASRENIIDFIEKSGKLSLIKNDYYLSLRLRVFFEEQLKIFAKEITFKNITCLFVYERGGEYKTPLLHYLKETLKRVGIKIKIHLSEKYSFLATYIDEPGSHHFVLYLMPDNTATSQLAQIDFTHLNKLIFLLPPNFSNTFDVKIIESIKNRILFEKENYYISFFKILKKLSSHSNIKKCEEEFIRYYEKIQNIYQKTPEYPETQLLKALTFNTTKIKYLYGFFYWLKKSKLWLSLRGLLSVLTFLLLTFTYMAQKPNEPIIFPSNIVFPKDTFFLDRSALLKQIDAKLKRGDGIRVVALTGMGGAGKTTLARHYVQQQSQKSIRWEINAETPENIRETFNSLAQGLAITEDDQKSLRGMQDIKNSKERESKVLQFVKDHLRTYPNWLLIYDNVEDFSNVLEYFPHDVDDWGQGKIILTTRNNNIQNNKYINACISIGELTPSQKIELFRKIIDSESISSYQNQEEVRSFLKKIPPFPLDVTVAAHYLKTTNSSYKEYLENLYSNNIHFSNTQENILKESGDYIRIRYNIITFSLEHILNINPEFNELLFFISLLDSQNIPKTLLREVKELSIVDNFIYYLNKHSLITQISDPIPSLSIHRSTQTIALTYLLGKLRQPQSNALIHSLVNAFEKYAYESVDNENLLNMRSLAMHAEVLLSHGSLLDNDSKGSIAGVLGCIYAYLGDYPRALQLLDESMASLKAGGSKNYFNIAQFLPYLGSVYLMLGNYEKALSAFEESLVFFNKCRCEDNTAIARIQANLGNIYREIGEYTKAIAYLEKSFSTYSKVLPENHHKIGAVLVILGNIYRALGNFEKAIDLLKKGLEIYKLHFSGDHSGIGWVLCHLGITYTELGNYDEATKCLGQSLVIYKKQFHETHAWTSWALTQLGILYCKKGNYEEGIKLLENNLVNFNKTYGESHIETARVLMNLGQAYLLKNSLDIAESYLKKSLKIFEGNSHPDKYIVLEALADLCLKKYLDGTINSQQQVNLKKQALSYLTRSQETIKAYFPKDSPHTIRIQHKRQLISLD
ncbi:MAG: tetratricopeptide repeat protein [Alphaproteobacteria bacterium]|nr:tetratricopeptide repeat protein [Alphaproteobacteria bacterium]